MSLRIVPPLSHASQTSNLSSTHSDSHTTTTTPLTLGAPSAPGLHDRLRSSSPQTTATTTSSSSANSGAATTTTTSTHPLESRLSAWRSTQENLKMESLRRVYGIAEPVRRQMELKMVREGGWKPAILGPGDRALHEDVLEGRDAEIGWEDVFRTKEELGLAEVEGLGMGVHAEMEGKVRMNAW